MDKMREDFNNWIDSLDFKQLDDLCEQSAWQAWQASRQALVVELPDSWDSNISISSYSVRVHDALDNAGIKWTE